MTQDLFQMRETAWCPGCGNFSILKTLQSVLTNLGRPPHEILLVGGIGQAAKLPQYLNTNSFCGLHGRALPAAVAAKIANENLTVIVTTGDGDSYGEGGNHFLHNIRRNVNITHFVHDNQIYGLTKGQVSPTTDACVSADDPHVCNMNIPFNPMAIALAAGAGFVARSFTGMPEHLAKTMKGAILHDGYALVDILQPCVSFNKVNTFQYDKEHVYELDASHDPTNRLAAMKLAMEHDGQIPIGIFFQEQIPTFHRKNKVLSDDTPLVDREYDENVVADFCRALV